MTGRRTVPGLVLALAALVAGCGGETPSEPRATTEVAMAKSTYH